LLETSFIDCADEFCVEEKMLLFNSKTVSVVPKLSGETRPFKKINIC
jgi:hypothetical protein